jgi:hypothetical protein
MESRRGARRSRGLLTAVVGILVLAAICAGQAGASAPVATSVNGTWAATGGAVVDQRALGSLTYLRQSGSSAFAGDLVGTTTFDLRILVWPDFSSSGWASETFEGRLAGRAGRLLMVERVTGGADGSARIEAVVIGGTGDLHDVRGTITFVAPLCIPETCEGTYSGMLRG